MKTALPSICFLLALAFGVNAQEVQSIESYPKIYEYNDPQEQDLRKAGERREFDQYYTRRSGMQVDSVVVTINNINIRLKPTSTNYFFWKEIGNFYPFWGEARVLGVRIAYHKHKANEGFDTYDINLYQATDNGSSGLPEEPLAFESFNASEISTGTELDSFTYIEFGSSQFTEVTQPFAVTVALEDVTAFSDSTDIVEIYSSLEGDGRGEQRTVLKLDNESIFWGGKEFYLLDRVVRQPNGNFYQFDYNLMMIPVMDVEAGVGHIDMSGLKFNGHFPNPAKNQITLDLDVAKVQDNFTIQVQTLGGQTLKTINTGFLAEGKQLINVDISDLAAGNYVYTISSDNASVSHKLVVVD